MMLHRYSCPGHLAEQLTELSGDQNGDIRPHNVTAEPRRYSANARGDGLPRCAAGDCIARVAWWLVVRTYGPMSRHG